jgi:hypothetical protein
MAGNKNGMFVGKIGSERGCPWTSIQQTLALTSVGYFTEDSELKSGDALL